MTDEARSKRVLWIVFGVVIIGAIVVFGRPLLTSGDAEDAAMKVRRPTPPARRAPGQIGMDPGAAPGAADAPPEGEASDDATDDANDDANEDK